MWSEWNVPHVAAAVQCVKSSWSHGSHAHFATSRRVAHPEGGPHVVFEHVFSFELVTLTHTAGLCLDASIVS
jgi:hypothetical protein